jgi:alpha-L-fucosidase
VDNEELQKMYGTFSWSDFLNMWNVKLEEVIYNYSPDLIWFDTWLDRIPQTNRQQFAATYLNSSKDNNQEVVITYKQNDLPQNVGVVDYEKGRLDKLTTFTWLTDDTISAGPWTTTGSWSFTHELDIKSSKELIHTLIDIVSKNGNLLLNISPRADGSIPNEQKDSLLGLGAWLEENGEAIYNTRPFKRFGEGPKRMASSGHFIEMKSDYNHENIRFTTNNDIIYAIQMGWMDGNKYTLIKSLSDSSLGKTVIKSIDVLGTDEVIDWKITSDGLMIKTPIVPPNHDAIVFRIITDGWNNINIKDEAVPMSKISVDG